jgi:hypothetical protein
VVEAYQSAGDIVSELVLLWASSVSKAACFLANHACCRHHHHHQQQHSRFRVAALLRRF